MKIVAIQDFLRVGGTEAQFLELTARWADRGHDVRRIVFRRGGALEANAMEAGPKPIYLQRARTPFNWWAPGLRRKVLDECPDRVICFGRNAHWSFSRAFRKGNGQGMVATVRTGRKLPEGYKRILKIAEKVVANSQYAAELAVSEGVPEDQIKVIENGCRLADATVPERDEARRILELNQDDVVVVSLGSFVPGKAQERLLKIWEDLPAGDRSRLHLWFVGDGPMRERLQQRAQGLPDAGKIRFWGNREDPELFLSAADALVSVSREESSPNSLVEALWVGIPVAAVECAGIADLIRKQEGSLLVEDSDKGLRELSRWISSLPDQRIERLRAAAASQEESRVRFDPQARADEYLALFEEMDSFQAPGRE